MRRLTGLAVVLVALTLPQAAGAAILPGQTIDGPNGDIKEFGNIDVAPDGTGAIVYRKNVGLTQAVFVSRIANGAFGPPERADDNSTNVASRPRVAASNGGKLVVVWLGAAGMGTQGIRGAVSPGTGQPFQEADVAFPAGANSWISADVDANPSGQAYATGTQNVNAFNVHAFRLDGTTWAPAGAAALDNSLGEKAGGGPGQDEPQVAVTGDGNAVAAWPEGADGALKEVHARRLTGTTPGAIITATVPTLDGRTRANNAFMVELDAEGNNVWAAFREDFTYPQSGGGDLDKARSLARRLVGNSFEPPQVVDGLPNPTDDGAEEPELSVNDSGQGLLGSYRQTANEGHGAALASGSWSTIGRLDQPPTDNKPFPTPAIGDNGAGLFVYFQRADNTKPFQALARTYVGGQLGPVVPVADTTLGSIAEGLDVSADANGNGYIGYFQSADAGTTIRLVGAIVDGPPQPQQPGPGAGGGGGGGGGDGGGGTTPVPTDTNAPNVTGTRLFPTSFAIGNGTPQSLNPAGRRVRVGTTIRFALSEDSRVRFSFDHPTVGRRVGRRCVRQTRRNRSRRRCTRFVSSGPSFTLNRPVGLNNVRFSGRLTARRRLSLGKHRLKVTPTDAAGNVGPFQRRSLTIVRRR
jgi:hypothetical protein